MGEGEGGVSQGSVAATEVGAIQYPQAPKCVSVQQWVALVLGGQMSVTTGDYLKDAVRLSWLLVKHLMQRIEAGNLSLLDIVVDNVVIFVDTQAAWQSSAGYLAVQAVQLQPGKPQNMRMTLPVTQNQACQEGEILNQERS